MVTIREWYERANDVWPDDLPELSVWESLRAARKLWRYATGRSFGGKIEPVRRSNEYTWVRRGVLYVNHNRVTFVPGRGCVGGWRSFVHDLGHCIDYRTGARRTAGRPHSKQHARLEARLAKQVLRRGWLDGKLKQHQPLPKGDM